MTAIDQAKAAMQRSIELTKGLATGHVPGPVALFDVYRELVEAYGAVSQSLSAKFSAKERTYLSRKIVEAKQYRKGRHDDKLTGKDAEMASKLEAGEELQHEIDAASEYEQHRQLLGAVDRAIDYVRSLCSFVKNEERGTGIPPREQ